VSVTAVVLSGGRGSRISSLYPEVPKPLIPAAGRPFLHWVTRWLASQGVGHIVYAAGYRAAQVQAWVEDQSSTTSLQLQCSVEAQPLDTAGAVRACLGECGETVVIINGDSLALTPLSEPLSRLIAGHRDGVLVGLRVEDAGRYGSLDVAADGRLRGFREKAPGRGLINAGLYCFPRRVLERIPQARSVSLEREFLPGLLAQGAHIDVVDTGGKAAVSFIDIGTPDTVCRATDFILAHPDAFPPLPSRTGI
jgi:D-glycero-alpha-D-manno-heptose 1-phosphate guanylyltransferase